MNDLTCMNAKHTVYPGFFLAFTKFAENGEKKLILILICTSHPLQFQKFILEKNTEYFVCVSNNLLIKINRE